MTLKEYLQRCDNCGEKYFVVATEINSAINNLFVKEPADIQQVVEELNEYLKELKKHLYWDEENNQL